MDPVVIGAVALGLSSSGLASVIFNATRHVLAERNLVRFMSKEPRRDALRELVGAKSKLTGESPDPVMLGRAIELFTEAAQSLRENQRNDIISTLNRGSEKSTANYIVKLINQIEKAGPPTGSAVRG